MKESVTRPTQPNLFTFFLESLGRKLFFHFGNFDRLEVVIEETCQIVPELLPHIPCLPMQEKRCVKTAYHFEGIIINYLSYTEHEKSKYV